jgi:outer membrane protein OmpA-like peptidoglycan-associated protein
MVVRAEPGRAGGGEITLTGLAPDERARTRLAADAAASVAPPFVVRTSIDIGMPRDSVSAADSTAARPVVVVATQGAEAAAGALREALAGAPLGFQPGTTTPDPASGLALERLASVLQSTPGARVQIAAPGEDSGSVSLERALARRRAGVIVDALVARGVDPEQVAAREGDELPAALTIHVFATGD